MLISGRTLAKANPREATPYALDVSVYAGRSVGRPSGDWVAAQGAALDLRWGLHLRLLAATDTSETPAPTRLHYASVTQAYAGYRGTYGGLGAGLAFGGARTLGDGWQVQTGFVVPGVYAEVMPWAGALLYARGGLGWSTTSSQHFASAALFDVGLALRLPLGGQRAFWLDARGGALFMEDARTDAAVLRMEFGVAFPVDGRGAQAAHRLRVFYRPWDLSDSTDRADVIGIGYAMHLHPEVNRRDPPPPE